MVHDLTSLLMTQAISPYALLLGIFYGLIFQEIAGYHIFHKYFQSSILVLRMATLQPCHRLMHTKSFFFNVKLPILSYSIT
mgnify:CR=1 FL=1